MSEPNFIPQTFQAVTPISANYDYTDIADGTGIVLFYCSKADDGTYKLDRQQSYSFDIDEETDTTTSGTFVKVYDKDFDLAPFNRPMDAMGRARVTIGSAIRSSRSSGTDNTTNYIVAKIRKWNGTTETEIAQGQSANDVNNSINFKPRICEIYIDINTAFHFEIGDQLRLTIEVYMKTDHDTAHCGIGHDPYNRDGDIFTPSTEDTHLNQMTFRMPFKQIDL